MKYALYSDKEEIQHIQGVKSRAGKLYNKSFYGYLNTPEARVQYAMASASRLLADSAHLIPPKLKMFQLITDNNPANLIGSLYLWTALIVFARQHKEKPIFEDTLWIHGDESIFDAQFKSFMGSKRHFFSKSSLYKTEFKTCLTPQMLEISDKAPLFKGISGELPIEEQTRLWLRCCSNVDTPILQNDIQAEEPAKHPLEPHLNELLSKLYDCNKNIKHSIRRCYSGAVSDHRNSPQLNSINKLLKRLCLSEDFDLHDTDLTILHFGPLGTVIKDWEKLSGIMIDRNFSKRIAPVLDNCRASLAYTLGLLYENDRDEQNALSYFTAALRQGSAEAFDHFKERGDRNDVSALYHLAIHYHHPRGEILDAVCLCFKALKLGSPAAKTYIENSEFSEILQTIKENHSPDLDSIEAGKEEGLIDTDSFEKHTPLDLARNYESPIKLHPNAPAKAFRAYFASAQSGNIDALDALERLAPKLSAKKQLALSELYAGFFANKEKAEYWQKTASESKPFPFDVNP